MMLFSIEIVTVETCLGTIIIAQENVENKAKLRNPRQKLSTCLPTFGQHVVVLSF